jgi:hypothetical protein
MEHRGVEYTVRAGLGPNLWVWTIFPETGEPVIGKLGGTRDKASASARQAIDRRLERHPVASDKTGAP